MAIESAELLRGIEVDGQYRPRRSEPEYRVFFSQQSPTLALVRAVHAVDLDSKTATLLMSLMNPNVQGAPDPLPLKLLVSASLGSMVHLGQDVPLGGIWHHASDEPLSEVYQMKIFGDLTDDQLHKAHMEQRKEGYRDRPEPFGLYQAKEAYLNIVHHLPEPLL